MSLKEVCKVSQPSCHADFTFSKPSDAPLWLKLCEEAL